MVFVNGYLLVMAMEMEQVKVKKLNHLQEIMDDREAYGWPANLSYHVAWLQHLEQGKSMWNDEATKLKLC